MKRNIILLVLIASILTLGTSCVSRQRSQSRNVTDGSQQEMNSIEDATDAFDDLYYKPCTREEFKEKAEQMKELDFIDSIKENPDGFLVTFSDGSKFFYLF